MNGIVLCRPRGGLNDMLCQIDKCWSYAVNHNRRLWIDTSKSGLLDCMGNYFDESPEFDFGNPFVDLPCDDCIPREVVGNLVSYKSEYCAELRNFVEPSTRTLLTFDFDREYTEKVLLHEQCGGGRQSINALGRLRIKGGLRNRILSTIEALKEYDAIHIRNTDYKTDYAEFFNRVGTEIAGGRALVLCTDDRGCQEYAKVFFGERLTILNEVPDTNGRPLHMNGTLERFSVNEGALTDLCVLGAANRLYYTKTTKGVVSGFSALADMLSSNRSILGKLLAVDMK